MRCPFCDSANVEETVQDEDRIECFDCEEFFYVDDAITDEDDEEDASDPEDY